ncbi:MAG: sigma-70 family RNA polymerase sigma factor [Minicystis sp.]
MGKLVSDTRYPGFSEEAARQKVLFTIWPEHHRRLYSLCLRWVGGDAQDAEDVLGQVALRALEEDGAETVISNYPGWLTRLARNLCMDVHRERAFRGRALQRISAIADQDMTLSEEHPEAAHLHRELGGHIQRAIDDLPARLREPCRLRFIEEMPYEPIAEELGLTNETVRKRIQEARDILRRRLGVYLRDSHAAGSASAASRIRR